ncbi:MAG: nuclear transport factor 2 family protein [Gemmatimonadota bacterium]
MIRLRILFVLGTVALTTRPVLAQNDPNTLRRLDSGWAQSYAQHDTAFAQALFADSMVVTGSTGQVKDREGELGDVRPLAGLEMKYFRTDDVKPRLHGDVAIVTGLAEWEFSYQGRNNHLRRRYTAVYTRGGSLGWEMIALHLSPAPEAPR